MLSWQFRDEHIFFPQQTVAVKSGDSVEYKTRGGMFICFPHFGPEITSKRLFGSMLQHGILRNTNLEVHHSTENSVSLRAFLGNPYGVYVNLFYEMTNEGFSTKALITNKNRRQQPFNFAFHPYFAVNGDWKKVKYSHAEGERKNGFKEVNVKKFPGEECHGGVKRKISIETFGNLNSGIFSIKSPKGPKIHMYTNGLEIGERMILKHQKYLLWSDNYEKYFCIEPYLEEPRTYGKKNGCWLLPETEVIFNLRFELIAK